MLQRPFAVSDARRQPHSVPDVFARLGNGVLKQCAMCKCSSNGGGKRASCAVLRGAGDARMTETLGDVTIGEPVGNLIAFGRSARDQYRDVVLLRKLMRCILGVGGRNGFAEDYTRFGE